VKFSPDSRYFATTGDNLNIIFLFDFIKILNSGNMDFSNLQGENSEEPI